MQKYFIVFAALFFSASSSAFDESNQDTKPSLTVVRLIADEWCPYTCLETLENKGLIVDVAVAAFAAVDMQVIYKSTSWKRAIREVETGRSDALLGADAARMENLYLAKDFLIIEEAVLVVLKESNISINTPSDLLKYKIGHMANYHYGGEAKWTDAIFNHPDVVALSGTYDETRLMELLVNKRINIAVMNIDVAKQYEKNNPKINKLKVIRKDIISDLHIGFSPNARGQELYLKFLEGYKRLKSTQKLKDIYAKYDVEMPS